MGATDRYGKQVEQKANSKISYERARTVNMELEQTCRYSTNNKTINEYGKIE